jgi:hypothetical protein
MSEAAPLPQPQPFDFDQIQVWGPQLFAELKDILPADIRGQLALRVPKYDPLDDLFELADRQDAASRVSEWLIVGQVFAYHGTRVTAEEMASIQRDGLLPLVPADRIARLQRSLSNHRRWVEVKDRLQSAIERFGAGPESIRQGQVHLTLSRAGLLQGFNYYLRQGSEFDWHVAGHLLGEEGQALISADGTSTLIKVRVPGPDALAACNPYQLEREVPNLVSEILRAWAYWLANPSFSSASMELDAGMLFRKAVPASWIEEISPLECPPSADPLHIG